MPDLGPNFCTNDHYGGDRIVVTSSIVDPDPLPLFTAYLSSHDGHFPLHPLLWV
ncbi:hypothetical protein AZE42_13722 [Rhizopogon vesiculosus]|uniref:Uncharacterized protein n=1 Tax=Rhizopogon vesiculosus TaxID=180088 RepID=A0A1J8REV2_9AGAM|nr:hypothetical protein AZE42_13722 [Rhizopogon vesiculosus]